MGQLDDTKIPVQPRPASCPVPLTAWQFRLWKEMPKCGVSLSEVGMCPVAVRVFGPLDTGLLERSIEAVVHRHESLRTTIVSVDGVPRQHIHPNCKYELEIIDLARMSAISAEREATRLAREFFQQKMNILVGPPFAGKLLKLSDREHVLMLGMDHMISDGLSRDVLARDIWTFYNQAVQRLPFSMPPLPVQFADYAVWQHQTYHAWLKKHEAYWRERLTGAPRLQLPLDDDSALVDYPSVAMLHVPLGKSLSVKLRGLAQQGQTLLPLVLLAIYIVEASRWCNQRDLLLTFLSHGRHGHPELENTIGFLANRLYLRVQITQDDTFLDLLKRITQEFYSANQHPDHGWVPGFIPKCTAQLYFNWMSANWTRRSVRHETEAHSPIELKPFPIRPTPNRLTEASSFAALMCSETAEGIDIVLSYPSAVFLPSTIERFGQNLRLIAEEVTQHPHARI